MDILKSIIVWITGICFIAITFPFTLIIWLLALPFDSERVVIHWFLMYQSYIISHLIPIWRIHIEGRENAKKGATYMIISNHQSLLDILMINCLIYKFRWVSKTENFKVPVIGWYLRMANYITVDRGNEESKTEMLEKSYNCLKNGVSIMMFPEGTRSLNNEISFYKRGAFQLAIQAGVPILPVLIDGTGGVLPKHGLIFGSGHQIRIRVMDPDDPANFGSDTPEVLAMRFSKLMASGLQELREQNTPR